jgi:hypothetical protein
MLPDAVLIQSPSIDFRTFIGLSHKVLGRSPAAPSDACRRDFPIPRTNGPLAPGSQKNVLPRAAS